MHQGVALKLVFAQPWAGPKRSAAWNGAGMKIPVLRADRTVVNASFGDYFLPPPALLPLHGSTWSRTPWHGQPWSHWNSVKRSKKQYRNSCTLVTDKSFKPRAEFWSFQQLSKSLIIMHFQIFPQPFLDVLIWRKTGYDIIYGENVCLIWISKGSTTETVKWTFLSYNPFPLSLNVWLWTWRLKTAHIPIYFSSMQNWIIAFQANRGDTFGLVLACIAVKNKILSSLVLFYSRKQVIQILDHPLPDVCVHQRNSCTDAPFICFHFSLQEDWGFG